MNSESQEKKAVLIPEAENVALLLDKNAAQADFGSRCCFLCKRERIFRIHSPELKAVTLECAVSTDPNFHAAANWI